MIPVRGRRYLFYFRPLCGSVLAVLPLRLSLPVLPDRDHLKDQASDGDGKARGITVQLNHPSLLL
jgi:hypothetical protein